MLVDGPWACVGAAACDVAFAACAVAAQAGRCRRSSWAGTHAGRAAPLDQLLPLAVAVVGFFVEASQRPPPPGLPRLRAFQAAQAVPGLRELLPPGRPPSLLGWRGEEAEHVAVRVVGMPPGHAVLGEVRPERAAELAPPAAAAMSGTCRSRCTRPGGAASATC